MNSIINHFLKLKRWLSLQRRYHKRATRIKYIEQESKICKKQFPMLAQVGLKRAGLPADFCFQDKHETFFTECTHPVTIATITLIRRRRSPHFLKTIHYQVVGAIVSYVPVADVNCGKLDDRSMLGRILQITNNNLQKLGIKKEEAAQSNYARW